MRDKKPIPPLSRIIRDGIVKTCPDCHSSVVKKYKFFGKIIGCINDMCINYYLSDLKYLEEGDFVALHNVFPPETKSDIGVIIEIKKDPLGFNYRVREFYDDKIYSHHISTIRPFKIKEIK